MAFDMTGMDIRNNSCGHSLDMPIEYVKALMAGTEDTLKKPVSCPTFGGKFTGGYSYYTKGKKLSFSQAAMASTKFCIMKSLPRLKPRVSASSVIWLWAFPMMAKVLLDHFFIRLVTIASDNWGSIPDDIAAYASHENLLRI